VVIVIEDSQRGAIRITAKNLKTVKNFMGWKKGTRNLAWHLQIGVNLKDAI
jgi:hypothetical protein